MTHLFNKNKTKKKFNPIRSFLRLFRQDNRSKSYKEALIADSEDEIDKSFNNNDKFTARTLIDSNDSKRAYGDSPKNNTINLNKRDSLPKRHSSSCDFLIGEANAGLNKDNENSKIKQNDNIPGSNDNINKLFQTPSYSKKKEYTSEKNIITSLQGSDRCPDSSTETARRNDKRSTNERLDELLIKSTPAKNQYEFVTSVPNKKRSSFSRFSRIFRNKNDKGKEKKEKKKEKKKVSFFDKLRTKDKSE